MSIDFDIIFCHPSLYEDDETTEHYLLCCRLHRLHRVALLENVSIILKFDVSTLSKRDLCLLLLYGDDNINEYSNRSLLQSTIKFIHDSGVVFHDMFCKSHPYVPLSIVYSITFSNQYNFCFQHYAAWWVSQVRPV